MHQWLLPAGARRNCGLWRPLARCTPMRHPLGWRPLKAQCPLALSLMAPRTGALPQPRRELWPPALAGHESRACSFMLPCAPGTEPPV